MMPILVQRLRTQTTFFPKIGEESGGLGYKRIGHRRLSLLVVRLPDDQAIEMADRTASQAALTLPQDRRRTDTVQRQPMVHKWLDDALCQRKVMDTTGIGEIGELHQNRNAAQNAASRIARLAQRGRVEFDVLSQPAPHDPVDRLGFEEKTFQHDNLHSKIGKWKVRFVPSSRDVSSAIQLPKQIRELGAVRHITGGGT